VKEETMTYLTKTAIFCVLINATPLAHSAPNSLSNVNPLLELLGLNKQANEAKPLPESSLKTGGAQGNPVIQTGGGQGDPNHS